MNCFVCTNFHNTLDGLILHYKTIHKFDRFSTYKCTITGCQSSFSRIATFKRHAKKHIIEENRNSNNPTLLNDSCTNSVGSKHDLPNQESDEHERSISEILSEFDIHIAKFTIKLYANNNFARSDVIFIQDIIKCGMLKPISDLIKALIKDNSGVENKLQIIADKCTHMFDNFSSEYKLVKWLKEKTLMQNVEEFVINRQIEIQYKNGESFYKEKDLKGVILPLKFQFQKHFEKQEILQYTLAKLESLKANNNAISNFVQGKLWKNKMLDSENKIMIPYFLYLDDLEINNPLGSNASLQSVCGIYYSFPLDANSSKLHNIFIAGFIKSTNLKDFGNEKCLKRIISEMNDLATNGVTIRTDSGPVKLFFVLGLLLGDNLAVNSICDFSRSFSANYFCRFCKCSKTETQNQCKADPEKLRTKENYLQDVQKQNFSETGISRVSIFNQLQKFHVVNNFSVDIMHDIFEEICHYDICHILLQFIDKRKYFTLDMLNCRKNSFNYGPVEIGNVSPPIQMNHIKNFHLKTSAREMMSLMYCLPVIIGDLVPKEDNVWKFFLKLLKLIDAVLSPKFDDENIKYLEFLIKEHNQDYTRLFQDSLKPKHHHLVHYPQIILQSGPLRFMWCMRMEAKHKEVKTYARVITSRKNIILSLAKKYQFKFAQYALDITPRQIEAKDYYKKDSLYKSQILDKFTNFSFSSIECYSKITFNGKQYQHGFYLTTFENVLHLHKILDIFVINESKDVVLVTEARIVNSYLEHYDAYLVKSDDCTEVSINDIKNFSGPPFNLLTNAKNERMFRLKDYFEFKN